MAIFYTPSCQHEVGGHSIYVMGIPLNTCSGAILQYHKYYLLS